MILIELPAITDWSILYQSIFFYPYLLFCYLYGSIPFGLFVSKLYYGSDIRDFGSGNIGATNMVRVFGKKSGIITFFLDFSKASFSCLIGWYLFKYYNTPAFLGGSIAVFGHTKSIFLKFKGGKGVASFFGLLLVLDWRIFLAAVLSWLLIYLLIRVSAMAAVVTLLFLPITIYRFHTNEVFWILTLLCLYIISQHYQNITNFLTSTKK